MTCDVVVSRCEHAVLNVINYNAVICSCEHVMPDVITDNAGISRCEYGALCRHIQRRDQQL